MNVFFEICSHLQYSTQIGDKAWILYMTKDSGKCPIKFGTKATVINKFQQPNFFFGKHDCSMNPCTPPMGGPLKIFLKFPYNFNTLHKFNAMLEHFTKVNTFLLCKVFQFCIKCF